MSACGRLSRLESRLEKLAANLVVTDNADDWWMRNVIARAPEDGDTDRRLHVRALLTRTEESQLKDAEWRAGAPSDVLEFPLDTWTPEARIEAAVLGEKIMRLHDEHEGWRQSGIKAGKIDYGDGLRVPQSCILAVYQELAAMMGGHGRG